MRQNDLGELHRCDGHVSTEQNKGLFLCVISTITIGALSFYGTSIYFGISLENFSLANTTLETDVDNAAYSCAGIVGLLLFFAYYNLIKAGLTDPGIITSNPSESMAEWDAFASRPPRRQRFTGGNRKKVHSHYTKFIDGANTFAPQSAELCSLCNNSILRFDHHCPWIGNCVGLRNYKNFLGFLISICSTQLLMFCFTIYILILTSQLLQEEEETSILLSLRMVALISMVLFILVAAFFSLPLLSLHLFLISRGKTTYQMVRRQKQGFNLSAIHARRLCCRQLPKSKIPK